MGHHTEHHRGRHPHEGHHHDRYARELDRRYPELYHRLVPFVETAHRTHHDISRMSHTQLHHLADRIMHESGVLRHLPHGHTEDTVRDMTKILLLSLDDGAAVETFSPLVPLALGLGLGPWAWPYYGFGGPWFPRRHFHRGRRGGHPGGHRGRR